MNRITGRTTGIVSWIRTIVSAQTSVFQNLVRRGPNKIDTMNPNVYVSRNAPPHIQLLWTGQCNCTNVFPFPHYITVITFHNRSTSLPHGDRPCPSLRNYLWSSSLLPSIRLSHACNALLPSCMYPQDLSDSTPFRTTEAERNFRTLWKGYPEHDISKEAM